MLKSLTRLLRPAGPAAPPEAPAGTMAEVPPILTAAETPVVDPLTAEVLAFAEPAPAPAEPEEGMTAEQVLAELNRDIPPGVDWKAGAHRYLAKYFAESGRETIEAYSFTKPMVALNEGGEHAHALAESVWYLNNFTNLIRLLNLPGGARVLDVACGAGWLSHYMSRFNYEAWGFDISGDFVDLARRRVAMDPFVPAPRREGLERRFIAHDIEEAPLPPGYGPEGGFDAIVLESCLHHFVNPIAALTHLARGLAPGGVIVLVEGENREGPIKPEYRQVMDETHTLERPYPRHLLRQVVRLAGLPAIEFMGAANGWVGERDPNAPHWTEVLRSATGAMNMSVCAPTEAALVRVFPYLAPRTQG